MKRVSFVLPTFLALAAPACADDVQIKLGVLTDLTGPYSDLSGRGSVTATQMAAEDFAAAFPNAKLKIEVVAADHQNKADVGSAIVGKWLDQDGVDAVLDITNSAVAMAVNNLTQKYNRVFLASGTASTALTGESCSPNTVQWTYDTYMMSYGTGTALTKQGADKWFFITADYAFGHALQNDTSAFVEAAGGAVVGSVSAPLNTHDYSSFLLQAQSSGASVLGLATGGMDTVTAVRQAAEFGLMQSGMRVASMLIMLTDVHSLGLEAAQGMVFTEPFYWDLNDETRAWSERFAERMDGMKPTAPQAGAYSAAMHYLKAVAELKSDNDGAAIVAKMKELPTADPVFGVGSIRPDGRKLHDVYLFQVKAPSESAGDWDYYKTLATIPGSEAFRAMDPSACELAK